MNRIAPNGLALMLLSGGALIAISPALSAHPDDPKILDAQPPVIAEPYRRDSPEDARRGAPDFESLDVELLSWLPVSTFGLGSAGAADIWGHTSPSGREYALITLSNGLSFVEITDPGNAQIVQTFAGPSSLWHDVKVYREYAYAVSEGGQGIRVYDMRNIDSGQILSRGTVLSGGAEATHNVAINTKSGYLYRTGGLNNGLRVYSLANPAAPLFVGSWDDRYVHDAQIVSYESVQINGQTVNNREIAFCCSGFNGGSVDTGLTIVDVTDKSNMVVLAQTAYSSRAYSHQAWLSEDRQYLYLNDELDEQNFGTTTTTRVFDVSDLANPVEVTTFTNGSNAIDHNLYIKDGLMYAANYRSGLRIFDVSDPLAVEEIAYFDTYPDSDSANFNGAWSVYPYFPSGSIVVSDIERGLFVLRYRPRQLEIASVDTPDSTIQPTGAIATVSITEVNGGELVEGSPRLVLNRGQGIESFPLSKVGKGEYLAEFPDLPCLDSVEYHFAADANDGSTVTFPANAATLGGLQATVVTALTEAFTENFDTDNEWIVGAPDDNATSGIWERGTPIGTIAQPDGALIGPFCYFTGQQPQGNNQAGANDVDNGKTTLISPVLDLSGEESGRYEIAYWRWYSNSAGSSPNSDVFNIDISNDDGKTWTSVEIIGPGGQETSGGWFEHRFNPADFIERTATVRMRYVASDFNPQALIEAAIDGFRLVHYECTPAKQLLGDVNGDGSVDLDDLNLVLSNFGQTTPQGDADGNGVIDLDDLNLVLSSFGQPG